MTVAEKLEINKNLTDNELCELIETNIYDAYLSLSADRVRRQFYGTDVYIRGLIEFTNYCGNNCYYCGIRRDNIKAARYRLSKEEILECCDTGYKSGLRTFVLQGGEDSHFTDDMICGVLIAIKEKFPECAVTLSMGEKPYESYKAYRNAGADRYLLRHETACDIHYRKLHPDNMSLNYRKQCLFNLKELGYQTGSGFMVGSPFQTTENLIADIRFLQELNPEMIGVGPYITHDNTPFKGHKNGSLELTLRLLSILRLMFPRALIPATTALGTISEEGRELGLKAGANVVMPNLSPVSVREKYTLYNGKIFTGEESAQCLESLKQKVENAGYNIIVSRGDYAN